MTAACFILTLLYGVLLSFGVFLDPLIAEFGWSNTLTSATYSIYWVTSSLSGLLMGVLADRYSPRIVLGVSGFLVGAGLALSSYASTIWNLYISFGVVGGIGAGGLWIPASVLVTRWFEGRQHVGLALGAVAAGTGAGSVFIAPLAGIWIGLFGWRQAYTSLAVLVWAVTIGATILLRAPQTKHRQAGSPSGLAVDISRTVHDKTFWTLLLAYALAVGLARQDVNVHLVSFMVEKGHLYSESVLSLAILGMASGVGRLLFGGFSEKLGERTMVSMCFMLQGLSTMLFVISQDILALYAFSFLFGLAWGGAVPQIPLIIKKSFEPRNFGMVFGLLAVGGGAGGIIGPALVGGYMHDMTGSYLLSFATDAVVAFAGAGVALLLVSSSRQDNALVYPRPARRRLKC